MFAAKKTSSSFNGRPKDMAEQPRDDLLSKVTIVSDRPDALWHWQANMSSLSVFALQKRPNIPKTPTIMEVENYPK